MKDKKLRPSRFTLAALCSSLALGSASAHAQTATRTLQVKAETRTYAIRIPPGISSAARALVLVFHGAGGTGTHIAAHTGFDRVADRAGFVAVYPDGIRRRWNDGRGGSSSSDVAFVRALLDTLHRELRIDSTRVFAIGISNGAMFAHRLACEMPGVFAAIAPVAGAMPAWLPAACRSSSVSMIALQGTLDRLVPFEGGYMGAARGALLSARETAAHWARAAGCRTGPIAESMPDRVRDGTRIQRIIYQGCGARGVELHAIIGGGHTWPGAPGGSSRLIGRTTREIDANEVIWDFFRRHARP